MAYHKVSVQWTRTTTDFKYENYNRNHDITFGGGSHLESSTPKEYLGSDALPNPEELLVSAVSTCFMLTFLAIACKFNFTIDSYKDQAVGITDKNAQGKMAVTEIVLEPVIKFSGDKLPDQATLDKIRDKAHDYCFISNSINSQLTIKLQTQK